MDIDDNVYAIILKKMQEAKDVLHGPIIGVLQTDLTYEKAQTSNHQACINWILKTSKISLMNFQFYFSQSSCQHRNGSFRSWIGSKTVFVQYANSKGFWNLCSICSWIDLWTPSTWSPRCWTSVDTVKCHYAIFLLRKFLSSWMWFIPESWKHRMEFLGMTILFAIKIARYSNKGRPDLGVAKGKNPFLS